jgi:hypothetical protein
VADFAQAAVRTVAEVEDAGLRVDTVWLGDHGRTPSDLFGSIVPPPTVRDDN